MTFFLSSIVDVTIVMSLSLVAAMAMNKRSAALRHAVLAAAILAALLVPVLELFVPQLPLVRWGQAAPVVSSSLTMTSAGADAMTAMSNAAVTSRGPAIPWSAVIVVVWTTGATVTLAGLAIAFARLRRLRARCTPLRVGRWREIADDLTRAGIRRSVALMQSPDRSLLVTCGVLRPLIILPAGTADWTDDRRRSVMAHELAHVRRLDAVTQLAGEWVRVLYWFNPLVWVACRRLRQECEHACDDAVLRAGVEPTEYATHLLDVARHAAGAPRAWAPVPAIAHPSTLERRISAVLNHSRDRQPLSHRARALAVLTMMAVILAVAAAEVAPPEPPSSIRAGRGDVTLTGVPMAPTPPPQPLVPADGANVAVVKRYPNRELARVGRSVALAADALAPVVATPVPAADAPATVAQVPVVVAGTMRDSTGAVLPGVRLTLTDTMVGREYSTFSDNNGRFAFRNIQPAQYSLVARLAGFATVNNVLSVESGGVERAITLPLGLLEETVTVICSTGAATVAPSAERAARLRQPEQRHSPTNGPGRFWHRAISALVPTLSAQQVVPVRVGGLVRPPVKIVDVRPACPTTVFLLSDANLKLVGRVGVDGYLNDLKPIASTDDAAAPPEIVESALEAVRKWRYTATQLNGEPVEADIIIRLRYQRM